MNVADFPHHEKRWRHWSERILSNWGEPPEWFVNPRLYEDGQMPFSREQWVLQSNLMHFLETYWLDDEERARWLDRALWSVDEASDLICNLRPADRFRFSVRGLELFSDYRAFAFEMIEDAVFAGELASVEVVCHDQQSTVRKVRPRELAKWINSKQSLQPIPIWMGETVNAEGENANRNLGLSESNAARQEESFQKSSIGEKLPEIPSSDGSNSESPAVQATSEEKTVPATRVKGIDDGRSNYTANNAKLTVRALVGALYLLTKGNDRGKFWKGSRIVASKLADEIVMKQYERIIWGQQSVELPKASTIARTLRDAFYLDRRRPSVKRRHSSYDDVRDQHILQSTLWCIQHDTSKCIREDKLLTVSIVGMILEKYVFIWKHEDYQRGTKEEEVNRLKRLTARFVGS